MFTIEDALTKRNKSPVPPKTLKSIKPGEAFKWVENPAYKGRNTNFWAMRLSIVAKHLQVRVFSVEFNTLEDAEFLWVYVEGPQAGHLFTDDGVAYIWQP